MAMKRTLIIGLAAVLFAVPSALAMFDFSDLPAGADDAWKGTSFFTTQIGGDSISGWINYAVYDTQSIDVPIAAPGGRRYVYAYQIFTFGNASESLAAITYFGLKGINPEAIASKDDIDYEPVEGGIDPTQVGYNDDKTQAFFLFADGALVITEKSSILLLGSDYTPIVGTYEFVSDSDNTAPVPGGVPIPEPATMALLVSGAVLSLRRRK